MQVMKAGYFVRWYAIAVLAVCGFARLNYAADVISLTVSGKGYKQVGPFISSEKLTTDKIVKAGLDEDTKQPNEVLAVLINCNSLSNVVVWDTFQSNVIVTIGAAEF